MKIKVIFICLLIVNFTSIINAQEIFYPEIEPLLNIKQKSELEKAINILLKARGNENNANDIERKYVKLKKKGNEDSWRSKTWEAKQQRVMAEKNYKLAYKTISDVYSDLITKAEYENSTYKSEALSLNKQALKKFEDANSILSQYSEPTQDFFEQADNKQIDSTLRKSHSLKLNGIGLQIAALEIFIEKGKQASIGKNDDIAWEKAKKANKISSYYEYLNNNPRGKHMADANENITLIEKQSSGNDIAETDNHKNPKNTTNNTNNIDTSSVNQNNKISNNRLAKGNLRFKVQVAASKEALSGWILKAKAPGVKDIVTIKKEGWFKYLSGDFNSYNQAAKYRDELRSHAPDAFIVVFSNGNQIPVTEEMKN